MKKDRSHDPVHQSRSRAQGGLARGSFIVGRCARLAVPAESWKVSVVGLRFAWQVEAVAFFLTAVCARSGHDDVLQDRRDSGEREQGVLRARSECRWMSICRDNRRPMALLCV